MFSMVVRIFFVVDLWNFRYSLCPRHKMARGHSLFALSVLPSFLPIKVCPLNSHCSWKVSVQRFWLTKFHLDWQNFELFFMYFSVRTDIILKIKENDWHVWKLFNFSVLLLHPCMDLNETWQGYCTTSLEVHVGREFMFGKFWQSYGPWHLEFLHILACLLNTSYIVALIWIRLGRDVAPQV